MRIDRLLWFLRFSRSRGAAQHWVEQGHIRCNSRRVVKNNSSVLPGDILTLPLAHRVLVIEILSLPDRRGSAEEAFSHYRALDAGNAIALAGRQSQTAKGISQL